MKKLISCIKLLIFIKMKTYKFVLLMIFTLFLFCNGSCEHKEGQRFIIQNNSEQKIIIQFSQYIPVSQVPDCMKPTTSSEYQNFIRDRMINPYSSKNFERNGGGIGELILSRPNDTLYIGVFNLIDIDTMSCEEFKQKFPIKHEWKVTLADMEACDWTLIYP